LIFLYFNRPYLSARRRGRIEIGPMDDYTCRAKAYLEKRFRTCNEAGIYYAHQPIYGLKKGPSDHEIFGNYIRTYEILKTLSGIEFESFLDVGGAEGYKTYLIEKILGKKGSNCDLSFEACKRAVDIFRIPSATADAHHLPYGDNAFDLVLCSETLEHVSEPEPVLLELLRIAEKAIVMTVPHEPRGRVDETVKREVPHGHINKFHVNSFDYLNKEGYLVLRQKIYSPLLFLPSIFFMEEIPRDIMRSYAPPGYNRKGILEILLLLYKMLRGVRKFTGKRTMAFFLKMDSILCKIIPRYRAILFVIIKDRNIDLQKESPSVSPRRILNIEMPHHYLDHGEGADSPAD